MTYRNSPEKICDALNRVTEAEYTEFDLPSTVTDALQNSVSFAYNPGRSLSEITDARGKAYSMDYDMHGLRETLGQPDSAATTWERNLGALLTEWTPRGSSGSAEYDYDSRNRVTSRSWTHNSLTATSSYTYNDAGRLEAATATFPQSIQSVAQAWTHDSGTCLEGKLQKEDLEQFDQWYQDYVDERWDEQIRRDIRSGKLDVLRSEVRRAEATKTLRTFP